MEMKLKEESGKVGLIIIANNEAEKMVLRDLYHKGEAHDFKVQIQSKVIDAVNG